MNMNEQNYLLNIDSKTGLAGIPSSFVDLILTDPPYGIADKAKLTKVGTRLFQRLRHGAMTFKTNGKTLMLTTNGLSHSLQSLSEFSKTTAQCSFSWTANTRA